MKFKVNKKILIMLVVGVVLVMFGYLGYNFFVASRLEFKNNEKLFLEGVKKYYDYNINDLPGVNGFRKVSLDDMYNGKWVEVLKVKNKLCNGDSFVRVINDNGNYRYITYLECDEYKSNVDASSPEIVLNGDSTVVAPLYSNYVDAGVKEVKDNKDSLKVSDVVVSSKVNTHKVGTYKVEYSVFDKAYNEGKVSRTVIVAETLSDNIKRTKGEKYTYTGNASDNYVLFSGMLFRIVNIDSEGNIKLITDNSISNVRYGEDDYKDSNIYTWLNEYFYNNINEKSKKYMKEVTWCYDNQENAGIIDTCNNKINAKVGLLSVSEFEKSKYNNATYLNSFDQFTLLNKASYNKTWITDPYTDNKLYAMGSNELVGTRPVIVLNEGIYLVSGNGSFTNPYKLQDYNYGKENEMLNTRLIGEYVRYSGYDFRISGIDKDGNIKLTAMELLISNVNNRYVNGSYDDTSSIKPDVSKEGNLYYKLNNDVINYIKEDYIVSHEFDIPVIDSTKKYNELSKTKIKADISIPASYELFSSNNGNSWNRERYWLSDYSENGRITILNGVNGIAFNLDASTFPYNSLKITFYLKNNVKIASGKGTVKEPYHVR